MDVMKLLEYLQEIIETSGKVPMTGKIMVDKKEVLEVIDKIINFLPPEFKKAQWILEEKERILGEAIKEAETMKKENIELIKRKIENHDITKEAKIRAQEIIASAQRDAKVMRLGARDYADEVLSGLEKEITKNSEGMLNKLHDEMEQFLIKINSEVNSTSSIIRDNIKELRDMKK
ncbi:cell division septum initiation protein DivIVA [Clostridium tetanomorphum]|uniref:ATPase n=1 Tax=Clostridium tetanomorphum TaxID=1553 RepID=A0A923J180_CLOTT|nr:hypothetical protein [Clostridium tetanomorphum]KAJ51524.1 hypothetical protein CTM_12240 [Clostridium tetanomorphum DSM 665]MBC2398877.1 ATPase [Clostridium tetanomorphum]MBP1865172.1 cell division septum initiation protein DivIVA [Clostridium tetanomorphum]NRS84689.1 cell division septum initiation protein DivIVA [Clostridium tetanomorphum]NRZ97904.1 cell division septum initiation protein DivIVA [Clostridium tetanomorphum]